MVMVDCMCRRSYTKQPKRFICMPDESSGVRKCSSRSKGRAEGMDSSPMRISRTSERSRKLYFCLDRHPTIKLKQPKIWRTNLRVFWWIQEHPWSSETGIQPFEHFHWYHLVPPKILKDRVKVNSMKVQIPLARFHIELGSNHTKVQRYKHQRHHRLLPLLLITHHLQFCFIAIF